MHALPSHFTELEPIGYRRSGAPIYPVLGGSEPAGGGDGGNGDGTGASSSNIGATGRAPAAQPRSGGDDGWKPPQTQEEFDRIFEDRLARERRKLADQYADYDDLKATAEEYTALVDASRSDHERQLEDTAKTAREQGRAEMVPHVVRAVFRAEAKGVLTNEQLDGLLSDVDLTAYAENGEPDLEKIANKLKPFTPAAQQPQYRNLGQGAFPQVHAAPGDAGRAAAASRFGTKTA